jgi:hypothetical protein
MMKILIVLSLMISPAKGFSFSKKSIDCDNYITRCNDDISRRQVIKSTLAISSLLGFPTTSLARQTGADDPTNQYAPSFVQDYGDFIKASDGDYSYKDIKIGNGESADVGDR